MKKIIGICMVCVLMVSCQWSGASRNQLTDYVNVFIGTGGHGHTFPGAAYPFGQIQLSPDNLTQGWDWTSGYHDSDSTIVGFSHLHLSGTGIGDLYDISVLPVNQEVAYLKGESNLDFITRYMGLYHKDDETARPGYYAVKMHNTGIQAELTVTERAGLHRYIFPESDVRNIVFNLGFAKHWDKTAETSLEVRNDQLILGMRKSVGWAPKQHVYFAARFSAPMVNHQILTTGSDELKAGVFSFDRDTVLVKVGLSSVSAVNAVQNLDASLPGWDVEQTAEAASDAWNEELSKIEIQSSDEDAKTIFYTALYHTMIAPVLFSDLNSEFKGIEGETLKAEGYQRYSIFSLWDTYRTLHPLYTVMHPDRVNDMVKSMLDHYEQSGMLPVWELQGTETNCMVGNHAISAIAEAIVKDLGDFDREAAFEAMKASSLKDLEGMGYHDRLGYIPADKVIESVAKALEYCIDDWAVAAAAEKLGKKEDHDYFMKRAGFYKNYWDESTGFFRPKLADGSWRTPFDPTHSKHSGSDYVEGNAWQYLWLVPHDPQGLIDLLGGRETFTAKLDQVFELEEGLTGAEASPDISGLIGAYAHGNEPGHHTAYLYNYAGEYGKTQALTRRIFKEMYKNAPDGLAGNEDCGQMSAWYILSSMGLYPVNPSDGQYQITAPAYEKAVIQLPSGKTFTVTAEGLSDDQFYIQSARLNGKKLTRSYITHEEIMSSGRLELKMGSAIPESLFQ